MPEIFRFQEGDAPLLVSLPHVGTDIPAEVRAVMTPVAAAVADTDWHVDRLYDFVAGLGASVVAARYSRYCIDLNRDPEGRSLYPGSSVTELCPTSTFDDEPLYVGGAPEPAEILRRRDAYWQPYHAKLRAELARLRAKHPRVLLWEGHSIRSTVPRFFEGRLPDLNFGTGGGKTADPALVGRLIAVAAASRFSHVVNGRFKGGYITRAYGNPEQGVHAVQLELAQDAYMDERPPFPWDPARAAELQGVLRRLLQAGLAWVKG